MNGIKYIRSQIINVTMDELAQMINVSKQSIYMWESGKKKIPELRLEQLSALSGIPVLYFKIQELSQEDIQEIKRYKIEKDVNDTMGKFDKREDETTELDNEELDDFMKKYFLTKFAGVLDHNTHVEYIMSIVRSMELFFNEASKTKQWDRELIPFPKEELINEAPLVQKLCEVLYEDKNRKIQKMKDESDNYMESLKRKYGRE